ncbi:MAG TPA: UbiD family decarboxylase domain-containing protein [Chloroflexota bacterium]|nr:UbiD family decarboxylase domain-containing protein [Chloroflexota bacterium]
MASIAPPAAVQTLNLHGFLEDYERDHPEEVIHVEQPIDVNGCELTALITKLEKAKQFPVLIFHNALVDGQPAELPLMTFLMASRQRLARSLDADVFHAGIACYERTEQRMKPVTVDRAEAPVKEVIQTGADIDVRRLPAPRHHQQDPGRYVTAGFFTTFNRETGVDNAAIQRGWISGRDEIRVFVGRQTHNWNNMRAYEDAGEDTPAAYWIGHHPLAVLGCQSHVGPNESHYDTAGGGLGSPLRLVASETFGDKLLVPADAEVVIEGYIPRNQRKPEGPFGEYTRYVGPQRFNPALKVTAVTRRRNAYWDDCMVGHTHWITSLTTEGAAFRILQEAVPGVRAVYLPQSGANGHLYVQIEKTADDDGRKAATAAMHGTFGMKHVFVFDEDVDIYDEREVLRALAWRFQADKQAIILSDLRGSPLDPTSPDGRTSKMGFDCTKPLGLPFPQRLSVPREVLEAVNPADLLGQARLDAVPVEPWG